MLSHQSDAALEEVPQDGCYTILGSDLIIAGKFQKETSKHFWISIAKVFKGQRYGLTSGDWIRLENMHTGECMAPFEISDYPEAIYFLRQSPRGWTMGKNESLVHKVENDSFRIFLNQGFHKLSTQNLKQEIQWFHQVFKLDRRNTVAVKDSSKLNQLKERSELINAYYFAPLDIAADFEVIFPDNIDEEEGHICSIPEKRAEYVGSVHELIDSLPKSLPSYQKMVHEYGIEGRIYVRFVVEKDSSISQVKILKGLQPNLDQELLEAIPSCCWSPALLGGEAVRSWYTLPFSFKYR